MNATPNNINDSLQEVQDIMNNAQEEVKLLDKKMTVAHAVVNNFKDELNSLINIIGAANNESFNKMISESSEDQAENKTTIVDTSVDNELKAKSEDKTTIVDTSIKAANNSDFKPEEKATAPLSKISLWVKPTNNVDFKPEEKEEEVKAEEITAKEETTEENKPSWIQKNEIKCLTN